MMRFRLRTLIIVLAIGPPLMVGLPTMWQIARDFRDLNRGKWLDYHNSNTPQPASGPYPVAVSLYKIFSE
jgi:hypothetical protein